jgi:hypothetical protein
MPLEGTDAPRPVPSDSTTKHGLVLAVLGRCGRRGAKGWPGQVLIGRTESAAMVVGCGGYGRGWKESRSLVVGLWHERDVNCVTEIMAGRGCL